MTVLYYQQNYKNEGKVKIDPRFDLENCAHTEKDYLCWIKNKESSFCGT